jgi:hypothetical protein
MADRVDFVDEYRSYLARFDQQVGKYDFGMPAKWKGRLVKKLSYEEFEAKLGEYQKFDAVYREILQRGDTVSDAVIKLLRDRSAELLMEVEI